MDGVPLASTEPAARPSFSRLEITVPEPSLISEWNSEDLHEFHSSSKNHQNESEIPEPPTHLREKRFVPNRPRRSEPTPLRPMNREFKKIKSFLSPTLSEFASSNDGENFIEEHK